MLILLKKEVVKEYRYVNKEDDFVEHIFITSTHNNILFFSN